MNVLTESFIQVFIGMFISFIISYSYAELMGINITVHENILLTILISLASIIRQYLVRKYFIKLQSKGNMSKHKELTNLELLYLTVSKKGKLISSSDGQFTGNFYHEEYLFGDENWTFYFDNSKLFDLERKPK